ncbi:MAG: NAD(P)H-dependent glycerol-3-phosphate dehydrogenase [Sulfuricaulis sp.]
MSGVSLDFADVKKNNPLRVLILGHGEMGRAMEYLLHSRHTLTIWERHPAPGLPPVELESAAAQQDIILFCLPANPHFDLASRLRVHRRPDSLYVSIAKGLDDQGRTAARALAQALGPEAAIAVLYGPMISEEIRGARPAFAQAGAAQTESFDRLRELFAGTPLYLEHSIDIEGISWSAVLKNVYAILFGVADELELGDNMRGYLATTAMHELERIVAGLGGSAGAAHRLAGLGDLITTATSKGSHHHELGRRLARGETGALTGEGVHTLKMVRAHRLFDSRRYPLFDLVGQLLDRPATARQLIKNFLGQLA